MSKVVKYNIGDIVRLKGTDANFGPTMCVTHIHQEGNRDSHLTCVWFNIYEDTQYAQAQMTKVPIECFYKVKNNE